jgi:TPR repeat protein
MPSFFLTDSLDPLRIAALPGVTLDVVVRDRPVRAEIESHPKPSNTSPSMEPSMESLQKAFTDRADEIIDTIRAQELNTIAVSTITTRDPVYGLENTAMDNYTHIDMPDHIRALSLRMILGPYQEQVNANLTSTIIFTDDTVNADTTNTAALTATAVRESVVGLESGAMDADNNNNNNPPLQPRGPHANLNDQLSSSVISIAPTSSQNSGPKTQSFRAPQESLPDDTDNIAKTMTNARLGNKDAQAALGRMYKNGDGVPQDYHQAMTWCLKAAKQGQPDGQFTTGSLYQHGEGVPTDYSLALYWLRKAAEQGHVQAQINLSCMYYQGRGVPQDKSCTAHWLRKAAEGGHAGAQYTLGFMYAEGLGVVQDYAQAIIWYLAAANQGHSDAQCRLGSLYKEGSGVPQDYGQAIIWYLKAADQGAPVGQYNIGALYSKGRGVALDNVLAMVWFQKAANQGFAAAQYNIGCLYEFGEGVKKDRAMALQWFKKAAEQGHSGAKECVTRLEK